MSGALFYDCEQAERMGNEGVGRGDSYVPLR